MNTLTRAENMAKFKEQVAAGKILVGVGAGTGITAKSSEAVFGQPSGLQGTGGIYDSAG